MLPDFGDGKTYLLFLLSLIGELIVVSGYFVLTSWPFKNLTELRSKLIVRVIDKFYDGTMSLVFGSSVTMSVAGALMPLYVAIGLAKPYGERQRREIIAVAIEAAKREWERREQQRPQPQPISPPAPAPQPEPPKPTYTPSSNPSANGDRLCADGRLAGWNAGTLGDASLATCQQGRFVAFVCVEGSPYLVTAGPARTTQVRFYSRDGRDRSPLDDTLWPQDEEDFAVSSLSAETFSYFMDGMAARLTMPGRTIRVDLSGVKRAASPSLAACMS